MVRIFIFCLVTLVFLPHAESQPSLLPLPVNISWNAERFVAGSGDIRNDSRVRMSLVKELTGVALNNDEAYSLAVTSDSIVVLAVTREGLFRARSTLDQLSFRHGDTLFFAGCSITDFPAFRIRGFMHDTGRSFIPLEELKREVEILSGFKINTFHWHLTEDIAWRLSSDIYPRLTDSLITLRDKSQFYSKEQVREFVAFCSDHFITVIPEIDMPGHSAAFERATGLSMQSPEGKELLKKLLHEACSLFDGPYFHIGTDEVAIRDPEFVKEMADVVRSSGKEVISWMPGGDPQGKAIRQLWVGNIMPPEGVTVIDSRFLYLNHTDPFADIFCVFNSRLCGSEKGSDLLAGAICCIWNDRKPSSVNDIILSNSFYPMMLAFSERSWRGGGRDIKERGTVMGNPGDPDYELFRDFENRLFNCRTRFLPDEPFPYLKQADLHWKIIGPFPNKGNPYAVFPPEDTLKEEYILDGKQYKAISVSGAGFYLRHTWGNMVASVFNSPEPNSTAYAYTWVFSPSDQDVGFYLGFHDYGRSETDEAPQPGKWDYKESRVWLNDKIVPAPEWSAHKSHHVSLEQPYAEENFWLRQPFKVHLNKGWNKVLLKLPVGSFSDSHTRLVKWMFVAIFTTSDGKYVPEGLIYSPERELPSGTVKVACIGNSVTYGAGINGRDSLSYPAQLQKKLGGKYIIGNFGKSGATLLKNGFRPYFKTDEFRAALLFHPEIAIIHLGLNDTDPRAWPDHRDEFIADYLWLIDTLKAEGVKKVYIAKMSPIFNGHKRFKAGTRDWYWEIQDAIEEVARAGTVSLIDFNSPLKSRPDLLPDNLHPVADGANLIAETAWSAISGNYGGLSLPWGWSDNMVLQRNTPITLNGTANRGVIVNVKLAGQERQAVTSETGQWNVTFDPLKAGGPFELSVTTSENEIITLRNILAGEVWLCSGQSNMEWSVANSSNSVMALNSCNDDGLRLLHFEHLPVSWNTPWDANTLASVNNLEFFMKNNWQVASGEAVKDFSAVGYYFAKYLREKLGVPVGIVEMAVGGSPAEAWIDRKTIEFNPWLIDMLYNYRENEYHEPWVKEAITKTLMNSSDSRQRHPFEPAYLYESGISRITDLPMKGFIWYQGESNANYPELYEKIFPQLVASWRDAWKDPRKPFYYAQLSSINRPSWPTFRDMQRKLQYIVPLSGMVVTSDIGDPVNVHPVNKKTVGERFALLALDETYGMNVRGRSPEPFRAYYNDSVLVITFTNAKYLRTSDGIEIRELEVLKSGLYQQVTGKILKNKIIINIKGIKSVRYGWKPFSSGNLVNESGLPLSTFKIDVEL